MGHGHASSPRSWRRAVALRAGACARGCCCSAPGCTLRARRGRGTRRWRALELGLLLLLPLPSGAALPCLLTCAAPYRT